MSKQKEKTKITEREREKERCIEMKEQKTKKIKSFERGGLMRLMCIFSIGPNKMPKGVYNFVVLRQGKLSSQDGEINAPSSEHNLNYWFY